MKRLRVIAGTIALGTFLSLCNVNKPVKKNRTARPLVEQIEKNVDKYPKKLNSPFYRRQKMMSTFIDEDWDNPKEFLDEYGDDLIKMAKIDPDGWLPVAILTYFGGRYQHLRFDVSDILRKIVMNKKLMKYVDELQTELTALKSECGINEGKWHECMHELLNMDVEFGPDIDQELLETCDEIVAQLREVETPKIDINQNALLSLIEYYDEYPVDPLLCFNDAFNLVAAIYATQDDEFIGMALGLLKDKVEGSESLDSNCSYAIQVAEITFGF